MKKFRDNFSQVWYFEGHNGVSLFYFVFKLLFYFFSFFWGGRGGGVGGLVEL